ncbi:MAG TPA: DUF6597 domain-containing transcriptional factor, partial [Acidimicrobiales bacterium]
MHREIPSRIRAAVGWVNQPDPAGSPVTVLPDGCMDLMWIDGRLLVSGADTTARVAPRSPGAKVGLRLAPGHLPTVLGLPADELVDQQVLLTEVPLDEAGRRAVEHAQNALTAAGPRVEVLETLAEQLGIGAATTGFADAVAHRALLGTDVRTMADDLGLGTRQLHRRCLAAFGYGPKLLSRVLR